MKEGVTMKLNENRLSERLYAALELAFKLHGQDSRKSSKVPVMAHLLAVCPLVQMESGDEDVAIAALLHDSLEDKPAEISRAEIKEKFGEHVIQSIEISSDTPPDFAGGEKPDWDMRKTAYKCHGAVATPRCLTCPSRIRWIMPAPSWLTTDGSDNYKEKLRINKDYRFPFARLCVLHNI